MTIRALKGMVGMDSRFQIAQREHRGYSHRVGSILRTFFLFFLA